MLGFLFVKSVIRNIFEDSILNLQILLMMFNRIVTVQNGGSVAIKVINYADQMFDIEGRELNTKPLVIDGCEGGFYIPLLFR